MDQVLQSDFVLFHTVADDIEQVFVATGGKPQPVVTLYPLTYPYFSSWTGLVSTLSVKMVILPVMALELTVQYSTAMA